MSELRVPPAVTFAFERFVADVCNQAQFDYDEWPLKAHEFLVHLQDRWRERVGAGLSTEAAMQQSFDLFGDSSNIGRSLREPYWKRVLLHRRCRPARYVVFLLGAVLTTISEMIRFAPIGPQDTPFSSIYDLYAMIAPMPVCFAAIAILPLLRWRPRMQNPWLRRLAELRFLITPIYLPVLWYVFYVPTTLLLPFKDPIPSMPTKLWDNIVWHTFHYSVLALAWFGGIALLCELNAIFRPRKPNRDVLPVQLMQ